MSDNSGLDSEGRTKIIAVVKTPLAFFALAVLVGEAGLLAFAAGPDDHNRTIGIVGMIVLLLASCAAVYSLAFRRRTEDLAFVHTVEGAWWERINFDEGSSLSFFTITGNPLTGSVMLAGSSYDVNGKYCAEWHSEMCRLFPSDRRITYLWQGNHPKKEEARFKFHGYGTVDFKPSEDSSSLICGSGSFWDVDETHPEKTVFKPVELRRIQDGVHKKIMVSGSTEEKQVLAQQIMRDW